ncbi:MAG: hypothetical protein ACRECH_02215 [Nitrososphaerales archaeon]
MTQTSETKNKSLVSPFVSFFKVIDGLSPLKKRTVRVESMLDSVDSQKMIYPNGVLGALVEADRESKPVRRIELFAEEQRKEIYGIIRTFFVAYSSEHTLLELAQVSNSVISVRAFSSSAQGRQDSRMVEDKLILKRTESEPEPVPYRARVPGLFVSSHWLDRMNLEKGNRIMVSNPLENYVVPPPNLVDT